MSDNKLHLPTLAKSLDAKDGAGMSVDFSDFQKGLKRLTKVSTSALNEGLAVSAGDLLRDAIERSPTVPIKEGILRASGSAFVANKLVKETNQEGKEGTPALHVRGLKNFEAVVGFNTPYAHRMHEGATFTFTNPGSGAFFLRYKVLAYGSRYRFTMARTLEKALKRDRGV